MKEFNYKGKTYIIDSSKKVPTYGDFNETTSTVYVDKEAPEVLHEGIAIHEIEELNMIKKGHSYVFSHNYAQKKELLFYQLKYGKQEGFNLLLREEELVLNYRGPNLRTKRIRHDTKNVPIIEIRLVKEATYDGKTYQVDSSRKLIHALSDFFETKNIIYIDKDVPEKFHEGLIIYEIELRRILKQGLGYQKARMESNLTELIFYQSKYSLDKGKQIMEEEYALQQQMFEKETEALSKDNYKIIYEKHEILPA